MVRWTHQVLGLAGSALCCIFIIGLTSGGRAATPADDIRDQQLKQQGVQVATEDVVQRIATMLKVMEYYQPDPTQQRKTLERVAATLLGLSRTQMEDVLRRLDRASSETDSNKSTKELQEAHSRHVEIMQTLRALLAEYETLSTLDMVADKLDKMAKTELELSLQSSKIVRDEEDPLQRNLSGGFGGGFGPRAGFSPAVIRAQNLKQLATEQDNLQKDLSDLLKKANGIQAKLPQEQRDLINQLRAAAEATQVEDTLKQTNKKLVDIDIMFTGDQQDRLRETNTLQRKAADDLKDLASVLRQGRDQLSALRKAQDQLDESIRQQQELQDKAKQQADNDAKNPFPELLDLPRPQFGGKKGGKKGGAFNNVPVVDDRGAKDMSDQQARISLDTRDTSNLLKPFAQDVAEQIDLARAPMKTAEELLRERTPLKAIEPQDKAIDSLREARDKVAELIKKAEANKNDPLAALQNAAETLEKLLKDQIATRDQTKDVGDAKEMDKLPKIAPQQKDLADRTNALNDRPLPTKAETQKALDKAAKSMDKAAKNLQDQKVEPAVTKQNDAIQSLQDAKKNLQDQIAEIEKRRDELAKLEDASQKLDKLTRDEGKIADQAVDKSQEAKANTKDLAKQQDKLTPQAKDLAKNLDKSVPKAADKINMGADKMDRAKKELAKNQAKPGAEEANKAVDRLKEAQAELAKKIDDLKAKELADLAAMKNVNQDAAMQQLQKAIEQAKLAMKESLKAQNDAAQKSLAEQQKQLADQAKQAKMDKAATPASAAAKDLTKGDLARALDNQKQALDRFQQANKKGDKNQPPPGEAKQGDPDQGQEGKGKKGQEPGEKGQQAAKAKTGDKGEQGKGKAGQSPDAQAKAKSGEKGEQGQAKTGGQPTPGQMAKRQQDLIDATKDLAQKQAMQAQMAAKPANQSAMQALGQAMAGTPQGAQQNMQNAAGQLGQAGQQLGQGSPGQAAQSQSQAIQEMLRAMKQMQAADVAQAKQAKQGQGKDGKDGKDGKGQQAKGDKKGQPKDQQAKAGKDGKGKDGKGQKQAKGDKQGKDGKDGKGQKQGVAQEKNNNKGDGNRIADGKVNNSDAQLREVTGSDTFLQLPPRQRELIRQALAGELPPEYAAQIQQYYLNISRGKAAIMPPPR